MKCIQQIEHQAARWCDTKQNDLGDARQKLKVLGGVARTPGFERLLTAFASAAPKDEMCELNPSLVDCEALLFAISCVLFRVTRINQMCRCLQACKEVKESTKKLTEQLQEVNKPRNTSGLAKDLCIKIDILVQQLSAARTICDFVDSEGSALVTFDRRFLVFEFLTGSDSFCCPGGPRGFLGLILVCLSSGQAS